MLASVRELVDRRDLLYMITWREVKIKYKQSVMGFLWAILMPLIIVGAGILVRSAFAIVSGEPLALEDILAVSIKAVPWAFLVSSIRFASNSLIANNNLVTKIYMPRTIFPVASVLSQLLDFAVASALLVVLLIVAGVGASPAILWVPVLLVPLLVIPTALGIFLSAAGLFLRDVKYIVEVLLTFAIFFTPVFYDVEMFGQWRTLLLINPVAAPLEGLSATIVHHQGPESWWILYSWLFAVGALALALAFFRKVEPYFAESI